ncbi:MAG: M28 family peptidase [bacterium]
MHTATKRSILNLHLLVTLFVALIFALPGRGLAKPKSEAKTLLQHVKYLADDDREGRGIGTKGLDEAADYIANQFNKDGLAPLFSDGYFQPFTMSWGVDVLPGCSITGSGGSTLEYGQDFTPLGFSGTGTVSAPVLFAGYGITASEYGYDDYEELDTGGKIVVILTGEPAAEREASKFAGTFTTDHSTLRTKAINAKTHGAAGMLLVRRYTNADSEDVLPELRADEPYRDAGIPVVQVTRAGFVKLFPDMKLENAQRSIDLNEAPRSMPLGTDSLTMVINLERGEVPVCNVGALIPGSDEVIVLGAHYDHLGYGQIGTNTPGVHEVHNGADDNASGVAVLIEAGRLLAKAHLGPTIWLVAFTGEEVGLVGSNHFVNNPPAPLNRVHFMLNFDMVGRMQDNKLTVYGVHSGEGIEAAAKRANENIGLDLAPTGGGYGASDQTSFYAKGIPVAHLLTALHADYHTPGDDVEFINAEGMDRVLKFAVSFTEEIAKSETMISYVKGAAPQQGEGRRGIRVSFGIIPDFSQPDSLRGLRLQGVREGTPAAAAGLQAMDIVVKMGDVIVDNIYDFTFALKKHMPGDVVDVVYIRDGEEHTTQVTLAESRGHGGPPPGATGEKH